MHKIDAPNATPANEFTDGDEVLGVIATELWAKWHNTVQRELIAVLVAAGIVPSDADDTQVIAAILSLIGTHAALTATHGATSAATPSRLLIRDAYGRAKMAAPAALDDIARLAEAGTFVNAANGAPFIGSAILLQNFIPTDGIVYESFGPTGSGATNTWTSLDVVPAGVGWVELACHGSVNFSGTEGYQGDIYVFARRHGSTYQGFENGIWRGGARLNWQGQGYCESVCRGIKVQVDASRRLAFAMENYLATSIDVRVCLTGWGGVQ